MEKQKFLKRIYLHLLDFIYPNICLACEKQYTESESAICFSCLWSLPKTDSHILAENPLESRFWGKLPVKGVYSFLNFTKRGKVQKIVFAIKYKGQQDLAVFMGRLYANELKDFLVISSIDALIPVPLHKKRLKTRGYNQASLFAQGLGQNLDIPIINDALIRQKYTVSQTKTGGTFKRFLNIENAFEIISPDKVKGKSVALVDDVLTSGATLEAAGAELLKAGVKELFIITLAAAI